MAQNLILLPKIIFDLKASIILVYDPNILSGQKTHNFIKVIS